MSKKTLVIIISVILLVVALGGILGSILNKGDIRPGESLSTEKVVLKNGDDKLTSESVLSVKPGGNLSVSVGVTHEKYLDYSVEVYAYEGTDFTYYQNGVAMSFKASNLKYTDRFQIAVQGGGFVLIPIDYSLTDLLDGLLNDDRLHGDPVTIDYSTVDFSKPMFRVVVKTVEEGIEASFLLRWIPNEKFDVNIIEKGVVF